MQDAIEFANVQGVIVVVAGNSNSNQIGSPGGDPGVVTVGATTQGNVKAPYSNYGTYVDIAAPGSGIFLHVPEQRDEGHERHVDGEPVRCRGGRAATSAVRLRGSRRSRS